MSYILDTTEEIEELVTKIVNDRGMNRTELNVTNLSHPLYSVEEWLGYISSSDLIVTNSFHGCIFSIIFNKPLIFTYNTQRGNARFFSLVELFNLNDNFITSIADYNPKKPYCLPPEIQNTLSQLKDESIKFLIDSLK